MVSHVRIHRTLRAGAAARPSSGEIRCRPLESSPAWSPPHQACVAIRAGCCKKRNCVPLGWQLIGKKHIQQTTYPIFFTETKKNSKSSLADYLLRVSPTVLKSLALLKFYWAQKRGSTKLALSQSLVSHMLRETSLSSVALSYLRPLLLSLFLSI